MCMQHLTHIDSIIKRCGTKIMAQTRLLSVTSNGTDVFGLNALMRQHSDRGGPKTVVRINCAQFSSQWNLSHHGVQCVDTNWLVFVPHPRLLETRTRPLPKVITGRVQLGHVLFKWRHRASTILFKHQLIFLTVMLGIILMILGKLVENNRYIPAPTTIALDGEGILSHRPQPLSAPTPKLQHQLHEYLALQSNWVIIWQHTSIIKLFHVLCIYRLLMFRGVHALALQLLQRSQKHVIRRSEVPVSRNVDCPRVGWFPNMPVNASANV